MAWACAAKAAARLAKAKGAFDDILVKVWRAQADALVIEALANRRIADEYDAAQLRGEVKANGGDRTVPIANSEQLGLSRKTIHEARQIRDAEETFPGSEAISAAAAAQVSIQGNISGRSPPTRLPCPSGAYRRLGGPVAASRQG